MKFGAKLAGRASNKYFHRGYVIQDVCGCKVTKISGYIQICEARTMAAKHDLPKVLLNWSIFPRSLCNRLKIRTFAVF
jgi:hypothetical protein